RRILTRAPAPGRPTAAGRRPVVSRRVLPRAPAPAPAAARLRPAASRAPAPLVPGPGAAPPRARPRPTARRLPSRPVGLPAPVIRRLVPATGDGVQTVIPAAAQTGSPTPPAGTGPRRSSGPFVRRQAGG